MPYSSFVLSGESRKEIFIKFPPTRSNVFAHHITVSYGSSRLPTLDVLRAVGYLDVAGVQLLLVSLGGETLRPDGNYYHCTISTDDGVPARRANSVIGNFLSDALPVDILITAFPNVSHQ